MASPIESFHWNHGAPNCAASTDPPLQTFQFDAQTFVIRQTKCLNFEGPFLYLLCGSEKALLLDTGAQPPAGRTVPVRETVRSLLGQSDIQLIVAHSHSHGDHVAGDSQFTGQPKTHLVQPSLADVKSFFGLPNWPDGSGSLDLGGRVLTILPIPGHEQTHMAIYDAKTKLLFSGDTLYPGLLTIQDWPAYRKSAARLAQFAASHEVSFVLGAHIEMKKTPSQMYPIGSPFQPDEHALPLGPQHIREWHEACERLGDHPHHDVHDEFILEPL